MAVIQYATSNPPRNGLLGCPPGDLTLRVCGTRYDGQVLHIRSAKCTIGSAESCTVRLRHPSIRPLHCLILRGTSGMIVRRFSSDTRLNNRHFVDAPLSLGDCLSVGPIQLEIVDDEVSVPPVSETTAIPPAPDAGARSDQDSTILCEGRDLNRRRARHILGQLRDERRALVSLKAELELSERQQSEEAESLHARLQELEAERDRWQCDRAQWDTARHTVIVEANTLRPTADHLQAELKNERAAWEHERLKLQRQLSDLRQDTNRSTELGKQLLAAEATATALRQNLNDVTERAELLREESEYLATERDSLVRQIEAQSQRQADELKRNERAEQLQAEVEQLRQQLTDMRQYQSDAAGSLADSPYYSSAAKDEAEYGERGSTFADRYGFASSAVSEDESPALAGRGQTIVWTPESGMAADTNAGHRSSQLPSNLRSAMDEPESVEPVAEPGFTVRADDEVQEESIEAYMERLMRRVRGEVEERYVRSEVSPTEDSPTESTAVEVQAEVTPAAPVAELTDDEPKTFVPRKVAPERSSNLGLMRELANESARAAIENSTVRQRRLRAIRKLTLAIISLVIGIESLVLSKSVLSWTVLGALVSFAGTVLWSVQFAKLRRSLAKKPGKSTAAVADANIAEPGIPPVSSDDNPFAGM